MTRKNKKMRFFVVLDKDNQKNFLTLTCDKNDAFDFAYKLIKLQKLNHFQLWCELRNLNKDSEEAWGLYYNTCVSREEKQQYIIREITYKLNDVAAIMRMFGGCVPLGCKFDTEQEYGYLKYKLETQKMAEEIKGAFEELNEKVKEAKNQELEQDGAQQG